MNDITARYIPEICRKAGYEVVKVYLDDHFLDGLLNDPSGHLRT